MVYNGLEFDHLQVYGRLVQSSVSCQYINTDSVKSSDNLFGFSLDILYFSSYLNLRAESAYSSFDPLGIEIRQ